ncbi:MAG: putative pAp phosphatase [Terrestrivirus sp.]|uniref:Putative pAp phosphatase n=1 Tax=Terrestrivirus sp. TaxID=2487775 RepID=A0A3G4ZLH4_9VIRU|nr:MAG: putative pAp phosphatase [Terrestrivirus sp.]
MLYDYIIYHKNCLDGFSAYFILTKTGLILKNDYFVYPDQPSAKEIPPNVKGHNVIILDVAYKSDVLEGIIEQAKSVIHIDHHITIRDDVMKLASKYKNKFISVYNEKESGASLTWKYFKKYLEGYSESMPKFVLYIKDNDIGEWKYKNTMPFITALNVHYDLIPNYETLRSWDKLFDTSEIKKLIRKGTIYMKYENYLLDYNAKRYTLELFPSEQVYKDFPNHFIKPGQYKVAVVNGSGCPSGSLLGKKIITDIDCDFCIMWTLHMDKKEYILSFRSNSVDVGQITKMFGGGGHIFAAACSIPLTKYNIVDLFYPTSLPRH